MPGMTLAELGAALVLVAGILASVGAIISFVSYWFKRLLENSLSPLNSKIDRLEANIERVEVSTQKNYIVSFLADIESGRRLTQVEYERFYENYDHYIKLGGDSYVKDRVEEMKKKGVI